MNCFVVGTGRCGSTLMSDLLSEHPKILVLSQFFGALDFLNRLKEGDVTGAELAEILARENESAELWVARGMTVKETLLEKDKMGAGVPALVTITLRALSPDPYGLLDEVTAWARKQPTAPLNIHYPKLFEWLMRKFGKTHWIERSGGSMLFLEELRRAFPAAKYVHIHRDGMETALSMVEHVAISEFVSFYFDPPSYAELERAVRNTDPPSSDPIRQRYRYKPSLAQYGEYWTYQMVKGFHAISKIPRENFMDIRFEDLTKKPRDTLRAVTSFFGIPDDGDWIERASAKIEREVPTRADKLPPGGYADLKRACLHGQILIGREKGESPVFEAVRMLREIRAK